MFTKEKRLTYLISNLIVIIVSTFLIISLRWLSIFKAGILYRELFVFEIIENNFKKNIASRIIFEELFYIILIFLFYFIFKQISKQIELNKMYLLIIVISPFLFDLSSIIYDKSCLKPWYSLEKIIWYFPIRLVLWTFLFWYFKSTFELLKSREKITQIAIIFIFFNLIKILNKNYL